MDVNVVMLLARVMMLLSMAGFVVVSGGTIWAVLALMIKRLRPRRFGLILLILILVGVASFWMLQVSYGAGLAAAEAGAR